jgi:hypothetical protein
VRVTLVFPAIADQALWEMDANFPAVPRVGEVIKIPDNLYAPPYNRSAWQVSTVHWHPDRPEGRVKVWLAR